MYVLPKPPQDANQPNPSEGLTLQKRIIGAVLPPLGLRYAAQDAQQRAQVAPVGSTVQKVGATIAKAGVENPDVARIIEGFLTPYRGVTEAATGITMPKRLVSEAPAKNDLLGKVEEIAGRIVGSYPLIALAGAGATALGAARGATITSKVLHELVTGGIFGATTTEGGPAQRAAGGQEMATAFAPFALAGGNRVVSGLKVALGSLMMDAAKNKDISGADLQNALLAGVMVGITSSGSKVLEAEAATKEAQKAALEVLGVGPKASAEEIKLAYRTLALQFHPDRGGSTETMTKINKAYSLLSGYEAPKISFDPFGEAQIAWSKIKAKFTRAPGQEIVPSEAKPTEIKSVEGKPAEVQQIAGKAVTTATAPKVTPVTATTKLPEVVKTPTTFYRGGGQGEIVRGKTAQDVVTYEQQELGNADVKTVEGIDLESIPSDKLAWVTETKETAQAYGDAEKVVLSNFRIIARDSFGGLLVEVNPVASKTEAPTVQTVSKEPAQAVTAPQAKLPPTEFDQVGAQQAIRDIEQGLIEAMVNGQNKEIGRGSKAIDAIVKEAKSAGVEMSRSTINQLREKADYLTSEQQGQLTIINKYEQFGKYGPDVQKLVDYYRRIINLHGEEAKTLNGMKITEHLPQGKGRQSSDELATSLGMTEGELMAKIKELATQKPKMAPEARANPFLREELKASFEKAQATPKPVEKGVETGVQKKASVEEILARGASFDRYASGRYFFAMEKYTHKDTSNAKWFAENIPLTRMGNKRGMIGYILNGLGVKDKNLGNVVNVPNALEITGVHDLFGGSGFLTVMTDKLFPQAARDLNEYDPDVVSYYREIQRDPKRVADWVTAIQDYVKKNPGKVDWKKELKLLRPDFQEDPSYRAAEFIVSYNDDISRGRGVTDAEFKRIITAIYNFSGDIKDVKVINSDAFAQIDHYIKNGTPKDFLWIDPPYIWSSGYGVGTELEKADGFTKILKQLDKLNEKGVKFMFFNNEPESRAATTEDTEKLKLPGLLAQLDDLSQRMTVIRNISPLGAQNREELMITNYMAPEDNKAIRPIQGLQDVLQYEVSVKGELPPDTKVYIAEATDKTLKKLEDREQLLSQREFDAIMKEADKRLFAEQGVKTPGQNMQAIQKELRVATNDAIRDRIMKEAGDVTIFDFARTPEGVFRKIGMAKEFSDLRAAQEAYEKELSETFDKFNGWFRSVKNIKDSRSRIFDYLDGSEGTILTAKEVDVANNISNFLVDLADRQGLPMEKRITNYITHIFEPELSKQQIPPEIMAALEFATPRGVFNPFLEKRLGASGYVRDVWRALESYTLRSLRKIHLDKPIDRFGAYVDYLPQGAQRYTKYFLNSIVGRPDFVEGLVDDTIRAAVKFLPEGEVKRYFSGRPTRKIFGSINMQVYRGALGLNVSSALKNLTQVVNTYSEEGEIATLVGYMALLNPQRWQEPQTKMLMNDIVGAEHRLTQFKSFLEKMDKGLFVLFDLAEKINRYSNYYAAKYNAKKKGMSEEEAVAYVRAQVRKTQFAYSKIDLPLLMHNPIGKSMIQFSTFPIKQAELIFGRIKNKEWAKLFRYIIGSLVLLYYTGDYLGLSWKDVLIRNVMPNMGPLPKAVGDAYTMMTSKLDSERRAAAQDLMYFKDLLIPAGVQLKRTLKGITAATQGQTSPTSTIHYLSPQSPLDMAKAAILGTRALQTIPGGVSGSKGGLPSGKSLPGSGKLPSKKKGLP